MILRLLDEMRSSRLDDAARTRLAEIHDRAVKELQASLAPGLAEELYGLWLPLAKGSPTSEEALRIGHAQLAGLIAGLVHGIQTAVAAQQTATRQLLALLQSGLAFPPARRHRPCCPGRRRSATPGRTSRQPEAGQRRSSRPIPLPGPSRGDSAANLAFRRSQEAIKPYPAPAIRPIIIPTAMPAESLN